MTETLTPGPSFLEVARVESKRWRRPFLEAVLDIAITDEQKRAYLTESTKACNPSAGPGSEDWWTVAQGIIAVVPGDDYFKFEAWTRVAKGLPSLVRPETPAVSRSRHQRR
jgi:hypothetical protein